MFRVFQIKNRLNGKVLIGSSVNMADDTDAHRSHTKEGVKLLIVD